MNWEWDTFASKEGVAFTLKSPDGRYFAHGMKPSFDIEVDLKGLHGLMVKVDNTIYRVQKEINDIKTKGPFQVS